MPNDVENVSNTVSQSLGSLVSGVLTIIGTVAIMFYYCWQLTLITMVTVVITGKISFRHVDFSYLPGKQVLYDFNLDVKP